MNQQSVPSSATDYLIDDSTNSYQRLVDFAGHFGELVESALSIVGLGAGSRLIDVGCGPIGALVTLASVAGPTGRVVGLDADATALSKARSILDQSGLERVSLIHANVNSIEPGALIEPGDFDAAYCRLFLTHQRDPVATLRRMAALVRPGGYIIAHHWLMDRDYPIYDPPLPASNRYVELAHEVMRQRGFAPDVPRHLGSICRLAGLEEVRQRGHVFSGVSFVPLYVACSYHTLAAIREAVVASGLESAASLDAILTELRNGLTTEFRDFTGVHWAELIARVPEARNVERA